MSNKENNYSKSIEVQANSSQVFSVLTKNLHLWWGTISKASFQKNGNFRVEFENGYWWNFKITEYIPNSKLTWICNGGEPKFNKEWIGNTLCWEIEEHKTTTRITFLQVGLTPEAHCYEVCATTWDSFLIKGLKNCLE